MNDFSKLFFGKNEKINIEKFKKFFELPKSGDDEKRAIRIQNKLKYVKNRDLDNKNSNINLNNENFENNENVNLIAIKNIRKKLELENDKEISLQQIQKENETSFIRCVGLTIETKSDFGKLYHGNLMLELGCTRVEIGIQSIYDNVLTATNRDNTTADNIESIRILKDLGFKINCHYMPGLPLTTKEMDIEGLKTLFESPDYRPDMLKIYPCMVMEGTKLYD